MKKNENDISKDLPMVARFFLKISFSSANLGENVEL